jgi:hypothetical protein
MLFANLVAPIERSEIRDGLSIDTNILFAAMQVYAIGRSLARARAARTSCGHPE